MERRAATDNLEFGLILESIDRKLEPYDPHVHDEYQRRNEEMRAKYKIRLKVVFGPEGSDIRKGENTIEIILGEAFDGTDNAWFCELQRTVINPMIKPVVRTGAYHHLLAIAS